MNHEPKQNDTQQTMTEKTRRTTNCETHQTMRSVSQQNPLDTENVFGHVFERGPVFVTDGGERSRGAQPPGDAVSPGDERAGEREPGDELDRRPPSEQTMKDVDQTPPGERANSNHVWKRGHEPSATEESSE